MIIGAVDTGAGTGFAFYNTDCGAFTSWEEHHTLELGGLEDSDVIIYEIYVPTARSNETETLRKIGRVEKYCDEHDIKCVGSPTSAKRLQPDAKLKALGWHTRTKDGHANDAARHLLAYLLKQRLLHKTDREKLKTLLT